MSETKPMFFDSFYVSILSEEYKSGKKKIYKGIIVGAISNIIGWLTKRGFQAQFMFLKKRTNFKPLFRLF